MKKLKTISTLSLVILMFFSIKTSAQEFPDLDKSPMDAASFPVSHKESNKVIKITYSRPQLKNRKIDKLVPEGEVWRTGANEAPEITFYQPVSFGEHKIPAGTYSFFIINEGDKWTGVISKQLNAWGSYSYKQDNDVARFSVETQPADELIEAFSIVFEASDNGAIMHLGWGKIVASFPFGF